MCEKIDRLKKVMSKELSYNPENKREFRLASTKVLEELAKISNFIEEKVYFNSGGIAVSGEATLMGMWEENKGVYVMIQGKTFDRYNILIRTISHMHDYSGGSNNWYTLDNIKDMKDLEDILSCFKRVVI